MAGGDAAWDESGVALPFDGAEYAERLALLRRRMAAAGLDAVICVSPPSLFYFCGYDGQSYADEQALVITLDERAPVLIVRDIDLSLANGISAGGSAWGDKRPYHFPDEDPGRAVALEGPFLARALRAGAKRVGLEEGPVVPLLALFPALRGAARPAGWQLVDATELLRDRAHARFVKRPAEWRYIEDAAVIAAAGLAAAKAHARVGIREVELAAEIEYATRRRGSGVPGIPHLRRERGAHRDRPQRRFSTDRRLGSGEPVRCAFAAVRQRYQVTTLSGLPHGRAVARVPPGLRGLPRRARRAEILRSAPAPPSERAAESARQTLNRHRISAGNMGRWGYGVGIAYPPTWSELLRHQRAVEHASSRPG